MCTVSGEVQSAEACVGSGHGRSGKKNELRHSAGGVSGGHSTHCGFVGPKVGANDGANDGEFDGALVGR